MTAATRRGTTRYLIGLVASVVSASICSVTRMVPSLGGDRGGDAARHHQAGDHRAQLARDADQHDHAARRLRRRSGCRRYRSASASTPPVKKAVSPTTGSEK